MAAELWVYAEQDGGIWHDGLPEVVAEGRALADKAGAALAALVLAGDDRPSLQHLGSWGVDKVYVARDPRLSRYCSDAHAAAVAAILGSRPAWAFLAGATPRGDDLCAVVAARLGTALVAACVALDLTAEGALQAERLVFGGKLHAKVTCPAARPPVVTLRLRGGAANRLRKGATLAVEELPLPPELGPLRLETLGHLKADPATVDLTEADVIVAGGRGVGSAAGFAALRGLAAALGAAVGGTRVAVDEGWLPLARQIGQTGKVVAPRLYVACGISGAIHHTAGIKDSKLIVAVNNDRHAPIFKVADVGIVGDLHAVVPALTRAVQRLQVDRPSEGAAALVGDAADALRDAGRTR